MGKIISKEELDKYNVEKFVFGSLKKEQVDKNQVFPFVKNIKVAKKDGSFSEEQEDLIDEKSQLDLQKEHQKTKKEFEELLKKVDELSSQVVSLEMELEKQKNEYEQKIKDIKEIAFNEGVKEAQKDLSEELEDVKKQYFESISSLEEFKIKVDKKLKEFEEELLETSIIISKKVIKKELEENSISIAKGLAKYLLDELEEEIDVTFLVSPRDFEEFKKQMGQIENKKIKIKADTSIKDGGVILLSDKKNIDATIQTRLQKVISLLKQI